MIWKSNMVGYLRKITKSKWPKKENLNQDEIWKHVNADAVTICLKTTKNTLSLWKIESEENIEKGMLAMISNMERPDTVDFIIIKEEIFNKYSFSYNDKEGITPYKEFVNKHRNITNLTYQKMEDVIKAVIDVLMSEKNCYRLKSSKVKDMILEAVEQGKINVMELNPNMREKLGLVVQEN